MSILTFNSENTCKLFLKKHDKAEPNWDGSNIGSIDNIANMVSTTVNVNLFYCSSGFYFILEKFSLVQLNIERLKRIFGLPFRRYNLCTYEKKNFFMFECDPNNEHPGKIKHAKNQKYHYYDRMLIIFYWIIGFRGNIWLFKVNDKLTITTNGPYVSKSSFSEVMEAKIFPNKEIKDEFYEFFSQDDKLELLSNEFCTRDRKLYLSILRKINSIAP